MSKESSQKITEKRLDFNQAFERRKWTLQVGNVY